MDVRRNLRLRSAHPARNPAGCTARQACGIGGVVHPAVLTRCPQCPPWLTVFPLSSDKLPPRMKNPRETAGFTPAELRKLRSLKDPYGIQRYLDDMPYHLADTAWSPRRVLHENTSHCLEGAMFAAAALRANGFPPLIWDLEAEHDTDHVLAIYRVKGHWGAVAKSNYTGCRYREPVYRSLRELAMSYFNLYFNLRRGRKLRTFSPPINLARLDHLKWMTTEKALRVILDYLFENPHTKLLRTGVAGRVYRDD